MISSDSASTFWGQFSFEDVPFFWQARSYADCVCVTPSMG